MDEYINKAKLMRKLKKLSTEAYQFKFESKMEKTINACIDVVDSMPTIDIVTCKECISKNGCLLYNSDCNDDWFCADGEVNK